MEKQEKLLEICDLESSFYTISGEVHAVQDVSFSVNKGEMIGIIGESGCGKSATALSIMGLLPGTGKVKNGKILFRGNDLLKIKPREQAKLRGRHISMVFQDSMTSLNPVFTIGSQMTDVLRYHKGMGQEAAKERVIQLLDMVGIPDPEKYYAAYPHELSGGMRQRVNIAMALSCEPDLLLADEPTTALDVTIQAQILELLKEMTAELGTAVLLITHDLSVIANTCSRVIVMYAGQIVEEGPVEDLFRTPRHPYTYGLLKTVLDLSTEKRGELYCIGGVPPQLVTLPQGCPYADRCKNAMEICRKYPPEMYTVGRQQVRCWLYDEECPVRGDAK